MLQIFYDDAPYAVLYQYDITQGIRQDRWTNFVRQPAETGPVLFTNTSPGLCTAAARRAAAATAARNTGLIIGVAAAGVAVLAGIGLFALRPPHRRGRRPGVTTHQPESCDIGREHPLPGPPGRRRVRDAGLRPGLQLLPLPHRRQRSARQVPRAGPDGGEAGGDHREVRARRFQVGAVRPVRAPDPPPRLRLLDRLRPTGVGRRSSNCSQTRCGWSGSRPSSRWPSACGSGPRQAGGGGAGSTGSARAPRCCSTPCPSSGSACSCWSSSAPAPDGSRRAACATWPATPPASTPCSTASTTCSCPP